MLQWFFLQKCYVNPASPLYKGDAFANKFWVDAGRKPPAPSPAAAPAGGTIAVAAIKDGTLVQNAPTLPILVTQTNTGMTVSVLPDLGATLNIASRASCLLWGQQIQKLAPGEANLTDVQGSAIPLLGKASISLSLPARGLHTTLSLVVLDTLGLEDLIVGWQDLQRWGVLKLQEGEVSGAQQFLRTQQVFPPKKTYQEIDPADPEHVTKMESA